MGDDRRASRRPAQRSDRSSWPRYLGWIIGITALVGLIAYIVVDAGSEPAGRPEAPEGTESFDVAEATHVSGPVTYPQDPPVGGPHNAQDAPCGVYDSPLPNELAVHTLEHGVVWITYAPDLPASEVSTLASKARGRKVLVSPYPGLSSPVIASAWGRQLRLDSVDDERLDQFIEAFIEGAQSPEPFASC